MDNQVKATQTDWTRRIAVSSLAISLCTCVGAAVSLQLQGKPIPVEMLGLSTASIGALVKISASPTQQKQDDDKTSELKKA